MTASASSASVPTPHLESSPLELACDKHVIVCSGYGSYTAYPCTLANAKALLADNEPERRLPKEALTLAQRAEEGTYRVAIEMLLRAMQEVMRLECGALSPALTRLISGPRPRVAAVAATEAAPEAAPAYLEHHVTQALKDEVTLWCVRRQLNPLRLDHLEVDELNQDTALGSFSLLQGVRERAKGRTVVFVRDADLQAAEEYRQLTQGRWKPEAQADRVVQRYLAFINNWLCDRETRYHVADLRNKA